MTSLQICLSPALLSHFAAAPLTDGHAFFVESGVWNIEFERARDMLAANAISSRDSEQEAHRLRDGEVFAVQPSPLMAWREVGLTVSTAGTARATERQGTEPVREAQAVPGTHAEPVRVNAYWSDDGVRMWLGVDASAAPSASALAWHIRQALAGQRVHIVSLTCNGVPLWGQSTPPINTLTKDHS